MAAVRERKTGRPVVEVKNNHAINIAQFILKVTMKKSTNTRDAEIENKHNGNNKVYMMLSGDMSRVIIKEKDELMCET